MRWVLLVLLLVSGCNRNEPTRPTTGTVSHVGEHASFHSRHEAFLAEGRNQKFEVICLGDSLTWGWDEHRELWKQEVTSKSTAFWAIGGDATNQLLWRIEHGELAHQEPRLIILLIGTNNRRIRDDADDLVRSIARVLQVLRVASSKTNLLLLGILPQGFDSKESSRKLFTDVNRMLPDVAKQYGAVFLDPSEALLESDGRLSTSTSDDGTHLTRHGYERLAKKLGPTVRELLQDGS